METTEIIGTLAGIFTTVAVIPQIYKALKTDKVKYISPVFFNFISRSWALDSLWDFKRGLANYYH